MNCIQCGAGNAENAIACSRCGTTLDETTEYFADALHAALASEKIRAQPNLRTRETTPRRGASLIAVVIVSLVVLLVVGIILLVWRSGGFR